MKSSISDFSEGFFHYSSNALTLTFKALWRGWRCLGLYGRRLPSRKVQTLNGGDHVCGMVCWCLRLAIGAG